MSQDNDDQAAAPDSRYLSSVSHAPHPRREEKLTPDEKKRCRTLLAQFFQQCEDNRADIDYSQHRPFRVHVTPDGFVGDCSSYVTQAFAWVQQRMPGVKLHDPNGHVEWDGYGYTGTLLATNHGHRIPLDRKFFVGDLAIYGTWNDTRHVTICKRNGTAVTARWSSHGSGAGPREESLTYRSDLIGVYRPVSLL